MVTLKSSTTETIVKWARTPARRRREILERLRSIRLQPPLNVPALISYAFVERGAGRAVLRLEFERVSGRPLQSSAEFSRTHPLRTQLLAAVNKSVENWKQIGFVHGDLSPRNILLDLHPQTGRLNRVWFIDWIVDLKGFEATPRYAAPEVFQGRRSVLTDQYAIDIILRS